jgi:predicted PurR-regulated permease PerM
MTDRTFIRRTLIVIALLALVFLFWQLRTLLLMLFGAVVVATIFRALAERIVKLTRMPIGIAVGLSVVIILGSIGLIAVLFGQQIGEQAKTLGKALPAAWTLFEARIGDMGLGEQLEQMVGSASAGGSGAFSGIGKIVMSLGSGLADTLVVVFGGIFLAAQPHFYKVGATKLVPEGKRGLVSDAMDDSEVALRLWLKGQLIAMLVVGTLTGLGLWWLGVPSALVLGLIAGLLEFVPFAGPVIAAIPAILLALAVSPDLALWVAILYIVVQQLEGYVLQPLVQQYAVELPGVILLFSLIGFGMLFGTLGIIVAAPLTVVTYVLVKKLYVREALGTETPIPGEEKTEDEAAQAG